ncbi:SAM-dependent methyltransferase [Actinomadura montaniterrae]|uniref:Bacterial transcriptional activator domain-containing protein n=1 Tax=Actinomadura montaniterrae TaxID=1803903 RepID=A0A6L3VJ73_9ACTN|nr:SAM-dependent methyltransferase [Actinomadura montaniterrae]KAB2363521.1 hypothetical protein F9B16_42905 [Actinomadura montaniterrae]
MQITVLNGVSAREGAKVHRLQPLMGAVLLALVVDGVNGPVDADRLLRLAWADGSAGRHVLHQTITRLRAELGRDRIEHDRGTDTYRFVARPGDSVDLWTWRELVDLCVKRSTSDPYAAVHLWERALSRWPMTGLRGLPATPGMDTLISGLRAERLRAVEQQAEVQLQLGLHSQVTIQLTPLVQEFWQREHLRGLLMTALSREQRGPDAVTLYRTYADRLANETGGAPGRQLQRLAEQITTNSMPPQELVLPPLPPADQAVIASGADPNELSIARMCVTLLDAHPAAPYNTALDRASTLTVMALFERLSRLETENLEFGHRFARAAIINHGISRFFELGALPPGWYSMHRAVNLASPDARVIYAHRDAALVAHSRQQLRENDSVDFVRGSILSAQRLLEEPAVHELFQLDKPLSEREPVAVVDRHEINMVSPVHDLKAMYAVLVEQMPAGSMLAITAPTPKDMDPRIAEHLAEVFGGRPTSEAIHVRTAEELVAVVPDGLELLPPSPTDSFRFWPEPGPAGVPGPWRQNSIVAIKR